jgi:ABC-type transport system involved in multi-copper enzyme maturation permease subunit
MMTETGRTSGSGLRIVLAIAWKDILDSLKNRVMIGVMIGVATLMVGAFAMRMLIGLSDQPRIAFAGSYGRELVRELRRVSEFPTFALEDQTALEIELGQSFTPALGVVLPDSFQPGGGAGGTLELTGYYPYWIAPEIIQETFESLERQLSEMWGAAVSISYAGNAVYPTLESTGQIVMVATGLVNALFIIGVVMTPGLIQEEKQTGTFSTLLVSPARMTHIALGKSLAGMTYCLAAAAIFSLMAAALIVHWSVIVIAVLAGSAFAVVLGLMIGTFSDEPASTNLWLGILLLGLLLPVFVGQFASELPAWLATVFGVLPTVSLSEMIRMSMTASIDWGRLVIELLTMLVPVVVFLGLSIWRIRKMDR